MGNKEAELSSRQEAEINPILKAKLDKRKDLFMIIFKFYEDKKLFNKQFNKYI